MADVRFLRSGLFWAWFVVALAITGTFFAWELRLNHLPVPGLMRMDATPFDLAFTGTLALLLSLAAGLFGWQRANGSCPIGVKRTVGAAGTLGAVALLCPVCLALPAAFLGLGTLVAAIGVYLPLIRLLAVVFAAVAVYLLWPKKA